MVEHPAVNRRVVGSNPTSGAKLLNTSRQPLTGCLDLCDPYVTGILAPRPSLPITDNRGPLSTVVMRCSRLFLCSRTPQGSEREG